MKGDTETAPLVPTKAIKETKTSINIHIILLTIFSGIGGLLFGFDTGIISGALLFISEEFHLDTLEDTHASLIKDIIVSGAVAGAIIGSLFIGPVLNRWGRKLTIIISSVIFALGSVIMAFSNTVTVLIVGRVAAGLAIGISSMTIPIYLAECSPADWRGSIVSVNVLMITSGQFIASIVVVLFAKLIEGWRWMVGLPVLFATLQFVGMLFLTESPRWLLNNGKIDEFRRVVCRLKLDLDVPGDLDGDGDSDASDVSNSNIQTSPANNYVDNKNKLCPTGAMTMRKLPSSVKKALIVGLGMQFFQQITGINTIMYYGASIIQIATGAGNVEAVWWNLGVALTNALFSLVGVYAIDRIGRRKLLLTSISGVFVSLVFLASTFLLPISHYYSVAGLILYLAFFAPGMGPVPWALNSEIYPYEYRNLANSWAAAVNWTTNLVVSLTFLVLMDVLSPASTFYLYSGIAFIALLFIVFKVPETKGLSLEEIGRVI